MAGETSRQNGKKGGRKPGTKNTATLEREAVNKAYVQKILTAANTLFEKQMELASGITYLFKTECTGRGKDRKCVYKQVTNPQEMEDYLNGVYENVEKGSGEDEAYYKMTVEKPDGKVIENMLNRGLGKAINVIATIDENDKISPLNGLMLTDEAIDRLIEAREQRRRK